MLVFRFPKFGGFEYVRICLENLTLVSVTMLIDENIKPYSLQPSFSFGITLTDYLAQ